MFDAKIDELVKTYLLCRDKVDELEAETKQKVNQLKIFMEEIEKQIAQKSLEEGVESYRTPYGTAFFTMTNRCSVADWDSVLTFVKENEAYDMLTKAVKKDSVRAYIEQYGKVPPGVDWATIRTFNCRKPTKE